jgi:glutathione S-transferase
MRRLFHLLMSRRADWFALSWARSASLMIWHCPTIRSAHLPAFADEDGTRVTGLWAVIDHIENVYPEPGLIPSETPERSEVLRLFDWMMGNFHEEATRRIVFEKASADIPANVSTPFAEHGECPRGNAKRCGRF